MLYIAFTQEYFALNPFVLSIDAGILRLIAPGSYLFFTFLLTSISLVPSMLYAIFISCTICSSNKYLALLWCSWLHCCHCLHLFRCFLRYRQVWCRYLRHYRPSSRPPCQEHCSRYYGRYYCHLRSRRVCPGL